MSLPRIFPLPRQQNGKPVFQLPGSAVGKREGEDPTRLHGSPAQVMRDPAHEQRRLPGAGTRDDQAARRIAINDGALLLVKNGGILRHGLRGGHLPRNGLPRGPFARLMRVLFEKARPAL